MGSVCYANQFYTIIGPDGRPIVVQRNAAEKKQTIQALETAQQQKQVQQKQLQENQQQDQFKQDKVHQVQQITAQTSVQVSKNTSTQVNKQLNQPNTNIPEQSATSQNQVDHIKANSTLHALQNEPNAAQQEISSVESVHQTGSVKEAAINKVAVKQSVLESLQQLPQQFAIDPSTVSVSKKTPDQASHASAQHKGFMEMAGEQYVKSEYLEDQEFNLEGKKRFYSMPEGIIDTKNGGGARMQVVERERGVSRSVLNKLFKKQSVAEPHAIVLAADYYRVNQAEAIESLGQQCFAESKKNKAKTLKAQQDLNLWPRAPLTEKFDYELVKLEGNIQNIQINSYAMKQNQPTFYWPFVVFLDQKGCVIEGAGGFRNQDTAGNVLRHEVIEGMLQLPKNSHYVLLTPLASAVDMEHRALSNQGQLKLIAIR
ncbi:putative pilus assembly protein FilE [Acinetobacter towneri]|uniref:putative pilus assembly protein FilE n=1 Tax=Acinetobacter towneri TaxID=202956 RepID=UPI001F421F4D|nr:putative pilus assembly protein FilE [Acinetobacter towneri]UIP25735.1 putative pilus assembly protein FilE [Acinetobacter towneri]